MASAAFSWSFFHRSVHQHRRGRPRHTHSGHRGWLDPPSNPKKWIQRFGRILRQRGDKKLARTYALISMHIHEKNKLLSVKRKTEKVYGFTQRLVVKPRTRPLPREQRTLTQYLR